MADITINGLTTTTSPATTDEVGIWDVGAGQYKKVTRANLVGATITGGGTIALGGYTLTVGATSTVTGSITGGGIVATGGYTLTVPATGTAALLATAGTYSAEQTFNGGIIVSRIRSADISMPDDSTVTLDIDTNCILIIAESSGANHAMFSLRGGVNAVIEIFDAANKFTTSAGSDGNMNVYYSSGYVLENKLGGTSVVNLFFIG